MRYLVALAALGLILVVGGTAGGNSVFNGAGDNEIDAYGYYYAITGGKFPNGQTVTGASGGTMRYITDDPAWNTWYGPSSAYDLDVWHKDGWFPQTAGLALTMNNGAATVFDNFNNDAGTFYTVPDGQATADTPGMYRGYSMSNNFDWIYAGYFKITEPTTVTTMIGYFDANAGFDPDNPLIRYRMNIWTNVAGDLLPVNTGSFAGDLFSTDGAAGTFSWGDTGVDRIFGADYAYAHDDILYLQYDLAAPLTLQPGEYWFSHDATIVPEPVTMAGVVLGLGSLAGYIRRRLSA